MVTSTWTEESIWMAVMLLTTSRGLFIRNHLHTFLRDKINHTLVDSHLEVFPGVGTLSARGLTGGDTQDLGGHADGTRNLHLLAEGNALDLRAH